MSLLYIIVGILNLIFMAALGYFSHRFFHNVRSKRFYQAHRTHHFSVYPKHDLISKTYRSAGKDNTFYLFAAIFAPIVIAAIILTLTSVIPFWMGIMILFEMLIISIVNEFLHNAFHLEKSLWHHFPNFKKLRTLHFIHHSFTRKNFGIYSYIFDKIFGTYRDKLK